MKLSFEYKETKVGYELMYKKVTAISIKITPEGKVNVTAPLGTTVQTVMDKVKGNASWIINELNKAGLQKHKEFVAEQYTYLGKNYGVEIVEKKEASMIDVKLTRGRFIIETPTEKPEEIRKALLEWYKNKVAAKIKERLKLYKNLFKEVPREIVVEYDKNILFKASRDGFWVSTIAGVLPVKILDYMLIKGLCSLNTSKDQDENKKIKEILPEYEESEKWLEENRQNLLL